MEKTFEQFCQEVHHLLTGKAQQKQYNATGPDSENRLYEFVQEMSGSHAHALGEIVYKAKRYAATGNLEDVAKIAAWAFLIWKHQK